MIIVLMKHSINNERIAQTLARPPHPYLAPVTLLEAFSLSIYIYIYTCIYI